jgi:hypothetical protein
MFDCSKKLDRLKQRTDFFRNNEKATTYLISKTELRFVHMPDVNTILG